MTADEGPAIATTAGRSFAGRHDQVAKLQASDVKEAGRLDFFSDPRSPRPHAFCRTLERALVGWARLQQPRAMHPCGFKPGWVCVTVRAPDISREGAAR
jgi:hypothetical protein